MIECKTAEDVRLLAKRVREQRKESWKKPKPAKAKPYILQRITPAAEDIIGVVCEFYGVTPIHLQSPRRTVNITKPRHVCMYLMRELTFMTCMQIAHTFRRYDHTSALHGANKIATLIQTDGELRAEVDYLTNKAAEVLRSRNAVTK